MTKRTIGSAVVALLLVLSSILGTAAMAAATPRASEYLSSYEATMYADGGGYVSADFNVFATGTANEVGATQIVIQRKNGSSWVTAQTFTSGLIGTNCTFRTGSVSHSGTAGQQYRAVVTFYARIGTGSTSRSYTTNTVTA